MVAYRIEPIVKQDASDPDPEVIKPPVLVPRYLNSGFNSTQMFI
jgi:hypothetical protein